METATPSEANWSNVITSTDHGALVSITAWLMLIAGLMVLGIRLCIRIPWRKLLGLDDYMTIFATILAIVHTSAILFAVKYGLGRHVQDLLENEGQATLRHMSRAIYIGEVFLVLGVAASKLSVSLLFVRLASGRRHVTPAYVLSGVITVWGLASFIGVAVSSPFLSTKLPEQPTSWPRWWAAISAVNLALEICLFVYPIYLVWDLQMSLKSKATVIIGFALRLPTSAIACMRLVAMIRASSYATDISWSYVQTAVYTEVEMHYSLIAATIPCMHIFLRHLSTGYLSTTADQYCTDGSRVGTNNDSYAMYSSSASAGKPSRPLVKEEHFDAAAAGFDFGDAFSSHNNDAEQKVSPRSSGLRLTGPTTHDHPPDTCPGITGAKEKLATDGGWELRPSGCGGTSTTKIVHSQHTSDGSVTSDGSDRIIIKKTVDVDYESK